MPSWRASFSRAPPRARWTPTKEFRSSYAGPNLRTPVSESTVANTLNASKYAFRSSSLRRRKFRRT